MPREPNVPVMITPKTTFWSSINTYAPLIQAGAAIISLGAVVWVGVWSNRNTNRTVQEMQAQRSLSVRPWLEVGPNASRSPLNTITIEDPNRPQQPPASLYLTNSGVGKAYSVRVRVPTQRGWIVLNDGIVVPSDEEVEVHFPPPAGPLLITVAYEDLDEVTHGFTITFERSNRFTVKRWKPQRN